MTELARLDGPGTAAVSDQLVAVCWVAGDGDRAWLVTHDLDTPARALYRSLGFRELGRGPLGWHDAERVVLGADLAAGRAEPDPPLSGPPVGEATSPPG
jgi:hypothetical protein